MRHRSTSSDFSADWNLGHQSGHHCLSECGSGSDEGVGGGAEVPSGGTRCRMLKPLEAFEVVTKSQEPDANGA